MFENWQGINPMDISDLWANYKTNNYSQTWKCNKQPHDITQNIYKGLTQW